MDSLGSTLFTLIWSDVVTPSGRRLYARRGSVLRTSDTASTSWPTPVKEDARSSARHGYMISGNQGTTMLDAARLAVTPAHWATPMHSDEKVRANRGQNAQGGASLPEMCYWPTPDAHAGDRGPRANPEAHYRPDGSKVQFTINAAAQTVIEPWPTPRATDGTKGPCERQETGNDLVTAAGWATPKAEDAPRGGSVEHLDGKRSNLMDQAHLAPWATPVATELGNTLESYRAMKANMKSGARTAITHPSLQAQLVVSGPTPSGSPASTGSRGQLNPELPRWLQGFEAGWGSFADTETRSTSKSRSSSSAQGSKRARKRKGETAP